MLDLLTARMERATVWLQRAYDTAHNVHPSQPGGAAIVVELSRAKEHLERARTLLDKSREH